MGKGRLPDIMRKVVRWDGLNIEGSPFAIFAANYLADDQQASDVVWNANTKRTKRVNRV
jgi:hypothetical protein